MSARRADTNIRGRYNSTGESPRLRPCGMRPVVLGVRRVVAGVKGCRLTTRIGRTRANSVPGFAETRPVP